MAISKEAKPLECRGRFRSDIIAGPSGLDKNSFESKLQMYSMYQLMQAME